MRDDDRPILVRGTISERDYVHAQWLHIRPRPALAVAGALILLFAVGFAGFAFVGWIQGHLSALEFLGLFFVLMYLPVWLGVFLPYRFRREYRLHMQTTPRVQLMLSEAGLHEEDSGDEASWSDLGRYRASTRVILIYQTAEVFLVLPRGLFECEAEFQRAKQLVGQNLRRL